MRRQDEKPWNFGWQVSRSSDIHSKTFSVSYLTFIVLILSILGLTACGSGGGKSTNTPGTAKIGPAGGTVISADGKLTLTIPAGALGNTETITIESVDPATLPSEFSGTNP